MKHTEWLCLQKEGENICAILRQKGYHCQKQARRLSWWVSKKGSKPYVLTYFTAPVREWTLLPNDDQPAREQLMLIVRNALDHQTESGTVTPLLSNPQTVSTEQQTEYDHRPWAIIRLLPDARRYTVARFANRQDAHDHLKTLNRFIPAAEFEIVFDPAD